jgi:hypothetical protein
VEVFKFPLRHDVVRGNSNNVVFVAAVFSAFFVVTMFWINECRRREYEGHVAYYMSMSFVFALLFIALMVGKLTFGCWHISVSGYCICLLRRKEVW